MTNEQMTQSVIDTLLETRDLLNKISDTILDDGDRHLAEWIADDCLERVQAIETIQYEQMMKANQIHIQ